MADRPTRVVAVADLRGLMRRLLMASGCDDEISAEAAEVFLEADLRGIGLQGLDHLATLLDDLRTGNVDPNGRPELVKEGPGTAVVNGNNGPGPVSALFAADVAIRKARQAGSCVVGLIDGADIYMIGYYAERIARAGLVGTVMSAAPSIVHAYGGVDRMLGTNPLAIAVPTAGEHPFLFDMSTSALSGSRIRQAAYHGEHVPEGSGIGPDGQPTTEAARITEGAIGPMAGHRGYGLGLCVALLSGPMVGGQVGSAIGGWSTEGKPSGRRGHFFQAIDPSAFGDADVFCDSVSAYFREIKDSRKAAGVSEIRIPGERVYAQREKSLRDGIEMLEAVWRIAADYAAKLGVEMPNGSGD